MSQIVIPKLCIIDVAVCTSNRFVCKTEVYHSVWHLLIKSTFCHPNFMRRTFADVHVESYAYMSQTKYEF